MKTICMFCGKEVEKGKNCSALCQAKTEVMNSLVKQLNGEVWKVMLAVERGIVNLDAEAQKLMKKKKATGSGT